MDPYNSFFNNTNKNVQQDLNTLQPFTPTPNPRSRFPQHLSGAPGLIHASSESFFINVLPPDNEVPLIPFPKIQQNLFSSDNYSNTSAQSLSLSPQSGSMQTLPQTLQVPIKLSSHYSSPGSDQKTQLRKKGFSVGTDTQPRHFGNEAGLKGYQDKSIEGSPNGSKTYKPTYRKSVGSGPRPAEKNLNMITEHKSMDTLQTSITISKSPFEEKNKSEHILITIEENQINTVSMLNEVSSKIKKRIEYMMNETPLGKNRVFECICYLEKDKIGVGKGNSKQAAKTEAAKAAITTLVTKDIYNVEAQAIMVSIQRASGQNGSLSPSVASKSTINSKSNIRSHSNIMSDIENSPVNSICDEQSLSHNNISTESGTKSANHMNDSPLYELNVIAKECFIEPKWTLTPQPDQNGEFEVELRFEKLLAYGKGKKKQDAKRDAAIKIIKQIRSSQELSERFNPKSKKLSTKIAGTSDSIIADKSNRFFEECISYKFFEKSHNKNFSLKEDIKKKNQELEAHLLALGQNDKLEDTDSEYFRLMFKKISDYTSMITSNTKQVMINAPRHIADYIYNCYIIPIGSFAVGCMRNDKLIADCLMIFEKVKDCEDHDLFELYKQALEECQNLEKQNYTHLDCKFTVKSDARGAYLEAQSLFEAQTLKINIYINNQGQQQTKSQSQNSDFKKFNFLITHVKQIYNTFENLSDDLANFRTLLITLRLWREKNSLNSLPTEIIDVILLNEFLTNKLLNISSTLITCFTILSSEEVMKAILKRYGAQYESLYQEISQSERGKILRISSQSLNSVLQGDYSSF